MNTIEIEVKIKQSPEDVEKILLAQGFTILQKVRTIANYYCNQNFSPSGLDLKSKSIRIRTSINLITNGTSKNFSIEHFSTEFDEILKSSSNRFSASHFKTKLLEKKILKTFRLILTDDKTDFVYLHPEYQKNKIAFQIQNINGIGIIVAYDNENYKNLSKTEQRKKLIADVTKYGIELKSETQVERYSHLLKNPIKLLIKDIIKIKNNYKK